MSTINAAGQQRFEFANPDDAVVAVRESVPHVVHERVPLSSAVGRILAENVATDRPSPPCDVSAMDGYAVARVEGLPATIPVAGEVQTGSAPPDLPPDAAIRIFTGGAVPSLAEAVIPREQTIEHADHIALRADVTIAPGQHIRRAGENAPAGATIAASGAVIPMPAMAAMAAFGVHAPAVFHKVRIGALVTGDELVPVDAEPERWQIRDSNRWSLHAFVAALPWATMHRIQHVVDSRPALIEALRQALAECDAVLLTGGVSMGDHDHVAAALSAVGAEEVFHWLPVRPGKPMLGAIGDGGQPIIGLPGNPVSAMTTLRRLGLPMLMKRAGIAHLPEPTAMVTVHTSDAKTLPLYWYRPVRRLDCHTVQLVESRGSGDLVSTAESDGFIELKPGESATGTVPFYSWDPTGV